MAFRAMSLPAFLLVASATAFAAPGELKRFPDLSRDAITFVHAGDLYVVARAGGEARRLTSAAGQELFPKFSPDGSRIAFSAEYNGTRQVYVMPTDGSEAPRQLTWYNDVGPMPPRGGFDYRVLDWTPDGRQILFRANRVPQDERGGRPYLIDADGGMETPLPVPETGGGMLSPDGRYYVYTPIDREFRTWKRYRGGRAQDLWIYDLEANDSRRLTDFRGTDNQPAWVGDTIYFTSDRGWLLNLWAISPSGGEARQVTDFSDYDVLFPSAGPDGVVFEKGGEIWLYEAATGEAKPVSIRIAGDRPETLPAVRNVARQIQSMALSQKGERALVAARGEIFSVPARQGEIRNLTRSTAREIDVSLSPDGRQMAYLSDQTGEYEIWMAATDGRGTPRQVTRDGSIWRFPPVFAPDGRKFAMADKRNRLQVIDAESGAATTVDTATVGAEITRYVFSPDSRWLAYVKDDDKSLSRIWLHELGSGRTQPVTSSMYAAGEPAFDPKGRWLYFVSARDYNLSFSAYEFNYLYTNAQRLYAVSLAADGPTLGRPRSDEIGQAPASLPVGWDGKSSLRIDPAGMDWREVVLRPAAGNYGALSATESGLVYLAGNGQGGQSLRYYDLNAEREDTVLASGGAYTLSGDGSRALVRNQSQLSIVELKPAQDFNAGALKLDRLELRIDPKAEWQQIYVDAWRILRDWFYDEGLHGTDWLGVRNKYQPLVDAAVSRDDLDWVLGELAGELNAGHVYHERGDSVSVTRRAGGLLGAEVTAVEGGLFRIGKIFPGESWSPIYRNPLREPGVDVRAGDFLLAVDGVDVRGVRNFYQLLEGKADQVVRLRVSAAADGANPREVDVRTVASEQNLRYLDWVETRRAYVEQLSGGRIGYVHLPNTAVDGNRELTRQLHPQIGKDALIIDDRYNGGGFIPDRMIEVLARQRLNYWKRRGLEPEATPLISHTGPKAMLVNGLSSSGGDALPYYFRKLGLGPVIGTRTWGGLIGISGNPGLVDGGNVLAATFRILSTEGEWVVENEGVTPDIEVIDAPHLIAAGRDPSVETAVQVLLEALQQNPPRRVTVPPAPTRFGDAE